MVRFSLAWSACWIEDPASYFHAKLRFDKTGSNVRPVLYHSSVFTKQKKNNSLWNPFMVWIEKIWWATLFASKNFHICSLCVVGKKFSMTVVMAQGVCCQFQFESSKRKTSNEHKPPAAFTNTLAEPWFLNWKCFSYSGGVFQFNGGY